MKKITAYDLLLEDLRQTKLDLELAYSNFENVIDPDLIDSSIYQVNAIQLRYQFLLGKVKQLEECSHGKSLNLHL